MEPPEALAAEAALVGARAAAEWLRGDVLQVLVVAAELDQEVYRVRGLDEGGRPAGLVNKVLFDEPAGGYVAVRGDHPDCTAVGLYRALSTEHTWLAVTSHRVAVLRLRDLAVGTAVGTASEEALAAAKEERSLGGVVRGLGKFVKASAAEFAKSVRRPPLAERPSDAVLECAFETPRQTLARVDHWKQPLVPGRARGVMGSAPAAGGCT